MSNNFMVTPHAGDAAVLLAFDLDESLLDKFAGFSIKCKTPQPGKYPYGEFYLSNMINFQNLTSDKKSVLTPSDQAPFQTFHWIHFPGAGPGQYQYTVYANYFDSNGNLKPKFENTVLVDLNYKTFSNLEIGFTRGYISSQAYANLFQNDQSVLPKKKTVDFDMSKNNDAYSWLGAHARKMIYDFLDESMKDNSTELDVFAYDLDEPNIISNLIKLGSRVRIFQDDYISESKLKDGTKKFDGHGLPDTPEMQAMNRMVKAGVHVRKGHFGRFSHDKIMIQKKDGKPVKVLTGSANFSMRGLYVQANSVLVFNDTYVAGLYENAFNQAFDDASGFSSSNIDSLRDSDDPGNLKTQFDSDSRKELGLFAKSDIASKWFDVKNNSNLPVLSVSFSPHKKSSSDEFVFTLATLDDAIKSANSSILFALMETSGGGPLIKDLQALDDKDNILSLGITQNEDKGFNINRKGIENTSIAHFDFLDKNIPVPFQQEWRGGAGQVIHHKFVVCDFNDKNPIVFCGSSNLAEGGETSNGDNLIAIQDKKIATYYAVEAIRLFDHYRFRDKHEKSTDNNPLTLDKSGEWTKPYYTPNDIRHLERELLICPS